MNVVLAETERLLIVRLNLESVTAALEDRARLETNLGFAVDPDWPLKDMRDLLAFVQNQLGAGSGGSHWGGVIVRKEPGVVIGDIGFHASPVDGQVEIGYSIVPAHRGNGFATEAVEAFARWGFQHPAIEQILARVELGNVPSERVLQNAGFSLEGQSDGFLRFCLRKGG